MGLDYEDCCLTPASESDNPADDEISKQRKTAYAIDFLLSFAGLDACKELPSGFDASILREFDDACNAVSERYRTPANPSLLGSRGREHNSSHYNRDSDSARHYGNQQQPLRHDGLLGSGAFPRVTGSKTENSARHCLLNKSDAPYRPPRLSKAQPHMEREINDSHNDETFGSAESLGQEKQEKETRRKVSFELMKKELQKAVYENQKQIAAKIEKNFDPNDATLLDDGHNKIVVNENNESEEPMPPPALNNESASSFHPTQTQATGLEEKESEKDIKDQQHPTQTQATGPEEKEPEKDINDQQHEDTTITVPLISDGERTAMPSIDVDISNKIVDFDNLLYGTSNFSGVCVAQADEVTDAEKVNWPGENTMSGLILENSIGCMINSGGSEEHLVRDGYNMKRTSSKFADWFLEEEKKSAGGTSPGDEKCGFDVHEVSNGRSTRNNPPNFSFDRNELREKPMKSPQTPTSYSSNAPTVTSGVRTCENLEPSMVSDINKYSSTQHWSVQGWKFCDKEDEQPKKNPDDERVSQHILSLQQKGAKLKDLECFSKLNMGSSDKNNKFEFGSASSVPNSFRLGNIENSKSLPLREISRTRTAPALKSTEAPVSIQRRSVGSITRNRDLEPSGVPPPAGESNFFLSTVDKRGSIGIIGEGILASNRAKKTGLVNIAEHQLGFDDACAKVKCHPQIGHGSKISTVFGFNGKGYSTDEIRLPKEDSLITIDDMIIPQHKNNPARDLINADLLNMGRTMSRADKLAAVYAAHSDPRFIVSELAGQPFLQGSYNAIGADTSYLNLHEQKSQPQLFRSQTNPGIRPRDSNRTQMSYQINSRNPEVFHHNSHLHHVPPNVLARPFQNTHTRPARFDHPVHPSQLQQMHLTGNFSHLPSGMPRGATLCPTDQTGNFSHLPSGMPRGATLCPTDQTGNFSHLPSGMPRGATLCPTDQTAYYRQDGNLMQSFPRNYQQPNYAGLGMTDSGSGVGGNNTQVAYNRLLEMKLRAAQMHPFPIGGHGQGNFGNMSTRDPGIENRSIWNDGVL